MRTLAMLGLVACGRVGFADVGDGGSDALVDATGCMFDLCDGFEVGDLTSSWSVGLGAGIDSMRAHRGTRSVHVSVPALAVGTSGYSQIGETATFASAVTTLHVRAWLYLNALPAAGNRMEMISIEQSPSGTGDYAFAFSNDTAVYAGFVTTTHLAGTPPPTDTWMCTLFDLTLATASTGHLGLGGDVPPVTFDNVVTDGTPGVGVVYVGIGFASSAVLAPQPAMDMWIDDIIVNRTPVTCSD